MGQHEAIRRHVPPSEHNVTETEFELLRQSHQNLHDYVHETLAHPEYGRITKVEKQVAVQADKEARRSGAAWVLLVIQGVVAFLAALAAIYSTFK